jgi:hypothetical protein
MTQRLINVCCFMLLSLAVFVELNILDLIGFIVYREWSLNAFRNSQCTVSPMEKDHQLDAQSCAGRMIKLSYRSVVFNLFVRLIQI